MESLKPLVHLIDRDSDSLEFMVEALRDAGYPVGASPNSADGLEQVLRRRPGVVITSLNMTDMTGLEMLRIIKEVLPETTVIFTSENGGWLEYETVLRKGAADLVFKPLSRKRVIRSVQRSVQTISRE